MAEFFKNLDQPVNLMNGQFFETNQRGELTATQQKQIKSTFGWGLMIFLALLMAVFGVIMGSIVVPVVLSEDLYDSIFLLLCIGGIFSSLILMLGIGLTVQAIKVFQLSQDIHNRAILQGQGQLVYNKNGYAFEMNGIKLRMPANLASGLLPGTTYQIHYLEISKLVISATMNHQPNPAAVRSAVNDILASANRFPGDAVLANQNGEVTFSQHSKLFPTIILSTLGIIGIFLFALAFVFAAISERDIQASIIGLILVIVVVGILAIMCLIALINALIDMLSSKLQQVQGQGYKDRRIVGSGRSRRVEYSYLIGGQRFTVNTQAYVALIDGLQYRAYYFPRTKKLLSIEVLDVGKL